MRTETKLLIEKIKKDYPFIILTATTSITEKDIAMIPELRELKRLLNFEESERKEKFKKSLKYRNY